MRDQTCVYRPEVIADTIMKLLHQRGTGKSICPSEVARQLAPEGEAWRALMPEVRGAAARLQARRLLVATRGDKVVDAEMAGGPIRLRLP